MQRIIAIAFTRLFSPEITWPATVIFVFSMTGLLTSAARAVLSPLYILVILSEFILPFALYGIFRARKWITDWDITNVKERRAFFTILASFHLLCIIVLWLYQNYLVTQSSTTALGTALAIYLKIRIIFWLVQVIGTSITFAWKISVHLILYTASAWVVTRIVILQNLQIDSTWQITLVVIWLLAPVIAWSRIVLKKHTLMQTIAGAGLATLAFAWPVLNFIITQ